MHANDAIGPIDAPIRGAPGGSPVRATSGQVAPRRLEGDGRARLAMPPAPSRHLNPVRDAFAVAVAPPHRVRRSGHRRPAESPRHRTACRPGRCRCTIPSRLP